MTTAEAPVLIDQIAGQPSRHPDAPSSAAVPVHAVCASYREAKVLAGSRRREGTDASAVYVIALGRWCVR